MAQIDTHALHRTRANGLHTRAFNGIEHRASDGLGRAVGHVDAIIMMPQSQRHAIGKATRFGHLIGRQKTARHRHPEVFANLRWGVSRKGELHFRLMRNRARGAGEHLLKLFERRLVGH